MLQLFPTTVIGLDLSDHSIEAVSLRRVFGRTMLRAFGRTTIPPGIVEDGLIHDVAAVAEAIRRCLTQATPQPIQARLCVVTLPESRVFIRRVQVPAVLSPAQVRSSVLNEVERHLPIALADCYFDYLVVGTTAQVRHVLFAATEKSVVHAYVEALRRVGLTPVAFDLESACSYRALVHRPLLGAPPTVAIVDFGARTTNASVFANGALLGSLTIPIAGNHLTQALVEKLSLLPAEAESAKRQAGLLATGSTNRISPVLQQTLRPLVEQLKRYVQYWQQSAGVTVSKLVLAGGTARLPGLSEHLRKELGVPVELPNPFQRVLTPRHVVSGRQTILYADVIGAGLRALVTHPEHAGLNLLSMAKDRASRERAQRFLHVPIWNPKLAALVATLLAGGVILGWLLWQRSQDRPRRTPAATVREVTLAVSYAPTASTSPDLLAGRLIRAPLAVTASGTATGPAQTEVIVSVRNETDADQTLVASTRLLADTGEVWRLAEEVVVPAGKPQAVRLQPSAIPPPAGRLTIPGLSAALRPRIYAVVASATPDVGARTVASQDVDAAAAAAIGQRHADALAALAAAGGADEWVLPTLIGHDASAVVPVPPVGATSTEFSLQGTVTVLGVAVPRAAILAQLGDALPSAALAWDDLTFTLEGVDLDGRVVRGILAIPLPVENSSAGVGEMAN